MALHVSNKDAEIPALRRALGTSTSRIAVWVLEGVEPCAEELDLVRPGERGAVRESDGIDGAWEAVQALEVQVGVRGEGGRSEGEGATVEDGIADQDSAAGFVQEREMSG